MQTDTIAAIATAMAPSGIGIIRISGDEALTIADKIFVSKKGAKKVSQMSTHTIHYGTIVDGDEIIDEVLLSVMLAPNTYTREDTIEINTHGGLLVMKKVLELVLSSGARLAEPGEYTKRAFLNGRIDLTQAESVIDLINAKNNYALKSSVQQLQGNIALKIRELRQSLLHEIAFIESALDDPEHYSLDEYPDTLAGIIGDMKDAIHHLIEKADDGRMIKEGINTVIVGKPNAGKSSLLNTLLGQERAIVTDIAGTTRDVLEEQIHLSGISLNIMDTAGIRKTDDTVEKIGVTKSKEYLEEADLVLYVVDTSAPLDENDEEIIQMIAEKKAIILLNKCDLEKVVTEDMIKEKSDHPLISVSMKEKIGVDILESQIRDMFFSGEIEFNDEIYISNVRQKNALMDAENSLDQVLGGIMACMPEDFLTIDMMSAYASLGSVIGEAIEDDLANEIFSSFCMGK